MRRETLPTALPEGGVNVHSIVCYNTVADPNIARNLTTLAEQKVKKTFSNSPIDLTEVMHSHALRSGAE